MVVANEATTVTEVVAKDDGSVMMRVPSEPPAETVIVAVVDEMTV